LIRDLTDGAGLETCVVAELALGPSGALVAGVLLPATRLQAAPASKKFGSLLPGKTFTFVVKERILVKTSRTKVVETKNPPKGIPNYAKGDKIKFTIDDKGQLTAKGLSMPFKTDPGTSNVYVMPPAKGRTAKANTGMVYKNSKGQPVVVALSFFKVEISGYVPTFQSVDYTLR
jgi:hypothetical protein